MAIQGRYAGRRSVAIVAALVLLCACVLVVAITVLSACGASPVSSTGQSPAATSAGPAGASSKSPRPKATKTTAVKPTAKPPAKPASPAGARAAGTVTVAFVDVGQGDGILIKAGAWAGLIDGGNRGQDGAVEAEMGRLGIHHLNALVVTHPHADHIGDLPAILRVDRPQVAYMDAGASTATYASLVSSLRSDGVAVRHAWRGQTIALGPLRAKVLSPGAGTTGPGTDLNGDSIVLLLNIDGHGVLLTGDCTGPNEQAVGELCARGPPVYLLKVAHHGSRYATSAAFLADVRARYAVVSVGPNPYGHPSADTLARLRGDHVRIYTTWHNGTIAVTFSASGAVAWSFSGARSAVTGSSSSGAGSSTAGGSSGTGSSAAGAAVSGDPIVYITNTGECYHLWGCRCLAHSHIAMRLSEAKRLGYRPCKICHPPE